MNNIPDLETKSNDPSISSVLTTIEALPIDEDNEELILVRWDDNQVPCRHGKHGPIHAVTDVSTETLYMASGTYKPGTVRGSGRSSKNLQRILWIPLDCDLDKFLGLPKRDVYGFSDERLSEEITRLRKRFLGVMHQMGIQVHRLDYTGYGVCGYIYLDAKTGSPENYRTLANIAKKIIATVNKKVKTKLIDPATSDPGTRINRVPGSPNIPKDGAAPEGTPVRYSRVLFLRDKKDRAYYSLDDLLDITGAKEAEEFDGTGDGIPLPVHGDPIPQKLKNYIAHICQGPVATNGTHAALFALTGFLAHKDFMIAEESALELLIALRNYFAPADLQNELKARTMVSQTWRAAREGRPVTGKQSRKDAGFKEKDFNELRTRLNKWVEARHEERLSAPDARFSFAGTTWARVF